MNLNIFIFLILGFLKCDLVLCGNKNQLTYIGTANRTNSRHQHQTTDQVAQNEQGRPVPSLTASLTLGKSGVILLQDVNLIDHLAHFNHERIPERRLHSGGIGAHGYFEVTHDISNYSRAVVFSPIGKKTQVFVRFSKCCERLGAPDFSNPVFGISTKFYTRHGNWDLLSIQTPVAFINDAIRNSPQTHAFGRDQRTNLLNPNSSWDYVNSRPEALYAFLQSFSYLGTPKGFRHLNTFGVHTFKLVNKNGKAVYVKFHWLTQQGAKYLNRAQAQNLTGTDPDYFTRDLYEAIESGQFPSWELNIQIMSFSQAAKYRWNPFDATKAWLIEDFPLFPVGRLVVNRNQVDHFTESEMSAFSPGNLVPGIEISPDRMLQGRITAYSDAQRYRLGTNFAQLAINRPHMPHSANTFNRDGSCVTGPKRNGNGGPNYFPNGFDSISVDTEAGESSFHIDGGDVDRYETGFDDNFSQPKLFVNKLSVKEREELVENVANSLKQVEGGIREKVVQNLMLVDTKFAKEVEIKSETDF